MQITPELLKSITNEEVLGTARLLPAKDDIPKIFWEKDNPYSELIHALYFQMALPAYQIVFKPGFEQCKADLNKCIDAHLKVQDIPFDYKVAGIAYLLSQVVELV